jgi:rare lipoprotein A
VPSHPKVVAIGDKTGACGTGGQYGQFLFHFLPSQRVNRNALDGMSVKESQKNTMNRIDMNTLLRLRLLAHLFLCGLCVTGLALSKSKYPRTQTGTAVYYSDRMDGRGVSLRGEKYDKNALTAAHKRYPLGSTVNVTNLRNRKSVTVKINDRMNPRSKAVIDVSRKVAEDLDMIRSGHAKVRLQLISTK